MFRRGGNGDQKRTHAESDSSDLQQQLGWSVGQGVACLAEYCTWEWSAGTYLRGSLGFQVLHGLLQLLDGIGPVQVAHQLQHPILSILHIETWKKS